jgi:hypothetical protein
MERVKLLHPDIPLAYSITLSMRADVNRRVRPLNTLLKQALMEIEPSAKQNGGESFDSSGRHFFELFYGYIFELFFPWFL